MNPSKFQTPQQKLKAIVQQYLQPGSSAETQVLMEIGGLSGIEQGLKTNLVNGIKGDFVDLKQRESVFGDNIIQLGLTRGFNELIQMTLNEPRLQFLQILCVAHILIKYFTAEERDKEYAWIEGVTILVGIGILAIVLAIINHYSDQQVKLQQKRDISRKFAQIIRGGEVMNYSIQDILVGDIIQLGSGDQVPADALVTEILATGDISRPYKCLLTDQSNFTGDLDVIYKIAINQSQLKQDLESNNLKTDTSFVLLGGSKVLFGRCRCLVIATGEDTLYGQIIQATAAQQEKEDTDMEQKVQMTALKAGSFGLAMTLLTLFAFFIRFFIQRIIDDDWNHKREWGEMVYFLVITACTFFIGVPKGLIHSMKFSLDNTIRKMYDKRILVKNREYVSLMGDIDCIIIDKSSLIGKSRWSVEELWYYDTIQIDLNKQYLSFTGTFTPTLLKYQGIALTCTHDSCINSRILKGSPGDISLLEYAKKLKFDYQLQRIAYEFLAQYPYTQNRKCSGAVINYKGKKMYFGKIDGKILSLPGNITKIHDKSDFQSEITEEMKAQIAEFLKSGNNEKNESVYFLVYKELKGSDDISQQDENNLYEIEKTDLVLINIILTSTVLRPEVMKAYSNCQQAGLDIQIISSSPKEVLKEIMMELEFAEFDERKFKSGDELELLTGDVIENPNFKSELARNRDRYSIANLESFKKHLPNINIVHSASGEDKLLFVTSLIASGKVVSFIGDCQAEVPAIKCADVGFSLGISGTEAARQVAGVILLDDSFSSLFQAIMWGRNSFDCIKKFLQFQLTTTSVLLFINFIGAMILKQEIISPIQILWTYFIMDALALLALATDPPNEDLFTRRHDQSEQTMISDQMYQHIIGQVIYQVTLLCVLIFAGDQFLPEYEDDYDSKYKTKFLSNWQMKYSDSGRTQVCSGRQIFVDGGKDDYNRIYNFNHIPSRHFTYIFNIFILLQLFNFFNCRRIHDEFNCCSEWFRNQQFFFMFALVFCIQIILVTFGEIAIHCYSYGGLTVLQWLICVGFGFTTVVWNMILKCIPQAKCLKTINRTNVVSPDSHDKNQDRSYFKDTEKLIATRQKAKIPI